jgi:hypothetical protein
MTDVPRFRTSLGSSDADRITVLGEDLAADLMGKVGFGELALWLVTQRRPAAGQVRVFEAVLVALADHGFTPTAITARLARAAGLLGHLAEEQRHPIGMDIYHTVEDNADYQTPALRTRPGPLDSGPA